MSKMFYINGIRASKDDLDRLMHDLLCHRVVVYFVSMDGKAIYLRTTN